MENHNKRVAKNPDLGQECDVQAEIDRVSDFNKFATSFLDKNRPTGTFAVDANVGLNLGQAAVIISPGFNQIAGTMQESHEVPMTTGEGMNPRAMATMSNNSMEIGLEDEYDVPGQKK